jgi:hypothetical protein
VLIFHPTVEQRGILQLIDSFNIFQHIPINIDCLRSFYRIGSSNQTVKEAGAFLFGNGFARSRDNTLTQTGIGNLISEDMGWSSSHIGEFYRMFQVLPVPYLFVAQRCESLANGPRPATLAKLSADRDEFSYHPCSLTIDECLRVQCGSFGGVFEMRGLKSHASRLAGDYGRLPSHDYRLNSHELKGAPQQTYFYGGYYHYQKREKPVGFVAPVFLHRHGGQFGDDYGLLLNCSLYVSAGVPVFLGCCRIDDRDRRSGWSLIGVGLILGSIGCASGIIGCLPWDWWRCVHDGKEHSQYQRFHDCNTVPHKYPLTNPNYWGTVMGIEDMQMAKILPAEKQVAVISALAEGSGIRQIERMTGVNRNTILNLGVRIGKD